MRIEAILKPKKAARQKKRKANDEVLDAFADDEVARLRDAMVNAAEEDIQANKERLPATAKLRLLPEVMETLRKYAVILKSSFTFFETNIDFYLGLHSLSQ
jgi:transcription factor SPN1